MRAHARSLHIRTTFHLIFSFSFNEKTVEQSLCITVLYSHCASPYTTVPTQNSVLPYCYAWAHIYCSAQRRCPLGLAPNQVTGDTKCLDVGATEYSPMYEVIRPTQAPRGYSHECSWDVGYYSIITSYEVLSIDYTCHNPSCVGAGCQTSAHNSTTVQCTAHKTGRDENRMARRFLMSALTLLAMSAAAVAAETLHSMEHYQIKYREWIKQYDVDLCSRDLAARLPIFAENRSVRLTCLSHWSSCACVGVYIKCRVSFLWETRGLSVRDLSSRIERVTLGTFLCLLQSYSHPCVLSITSTVLILSHSA